MARTVGRLQGSQLSVQALSRLSSVVVFLVASRVDGGHLVLVALQGALFAIPYTLVECLVGRPLSADQVPPGWDVDRWARRAAAATLVPVGLVCFVAASVALPATAPGDRLLMVAPVLVQLPLEAVFWSLARTRSPRRANLVPQLVSVGTVLGAGVFALAHLRLDLAPLPAQLLVLAWVLVSGEPAAGTVRPSVWHSVRVGLAYCVAAGADLVYVVALPAVAGRLVGPTAIVVLRAMELAFGPFNVALSASIREDILGGRASRRLTGARVLTVVLLVAVSVVVLGSVRVRGLLGADLAAASTAVLAAYCGYKALAMASSWLSVHHMIWSSPRRFLVSATGSRALAFAGLAAAFAWVDGTAQLFVQLLCVEALVVLWYWWRIRTSTVSPVPTVSDRL